MAQHLPNGDVALTVLRELWPVRGNPFVVVELPAVGQHMRAGGGDAFGGAPAHGKGVALPGVPARGANSTPHIDDKPAAVIDGHRGAAVGTRDLLPEDVRHFAELVVITAFGQIRSGRGSFQFPLFLLAHGGGRDEGVKALRMHPWVCPNPGRLPRVR